MDYLSYLFQKEVRSNPACREASLLKMLLVMNKICGLSLSILLFYLHGHVYCTSCGLAYFQKFMSCFLGRLGSGGSNPAGHSFTLT